jgi:putative colanic acid biosysnthesis UDP-glucose lipid carrier transferase
MFQDRSYKRTFYSAPQSVTSLVAAVLEPTLIVLVYLATALWFREPIMRPDLVLCLLVFALTFPGRNRYKEGMLNAATDLVASWITLLAILLLCAYATDSMHYFDRNVLLGWSIATPLVQWFAVWVGRSILRKRAQDPDIRKPAVVIGAGLLGVKVASALQGDREEGRDFLGWFDDRTDERLAGETSGHMLGGLKDAAPFIRAHGVKEVFITLPLGSQPRILELLESIQGTTASLFFVPDVFGISIIQGRLQD